MPTPKLNATFSRKAGVALDRAGLHLDGAAHGVDHAAELNEAPVAGALHYAPVMRGDGGIDQIAPQPAQSRKGAILIGASKPAVSDHVRYQYRCELPVFDHGILRGGRHTSTKLWSELTLTGTKNPGVFTK